MAASLPPPSAFALPLRARPHPTPAGRRPRSRRHPSVLSLLRHHHQMARFTPVHPLPLAATSTADAVRDCRGFPCVSDNRNYGDGVEFAPTFEKLYPSGLLVLANKLGKTCREQTVRDEFLKG